MINASRNWVRLLMEDGVRYSSGMRNLSFDGCLRHMLNIKYPLGNACAGCLARPPILGRHKKSIVLFYLHNFLRADLAFFVWIVLQRCKLHDQLRLIGTVSVVAGISHSALVSISDGTDQFSATVNNGKLNKLGVFYLYTTDCGCTVLTKRLPFVHSLLSVFP